MSENRALQPATERPIQLPVGGPEDAERPVRVLVLEDEPDVARMLSWAIKACGSYEVTQTTDASALESSLDEVQPDLVLTDLMMPGRDGFDVIQTVKQRDPDLPVVVISAYASLENAVEAVRMGAFDFLPKPFRPENIELMLAKVQRTHDLRLRADRATRSAQSCDPCLNALRGSSPIMQRLREWILKVRDTRASVVIEGESGTGKELVAQALHAGQGPFVAINVAAIPAELAEAELFGYRRGAFTGADHDHPGLLVEASGGVLFLDEINAMPLGLQAKLLRTLQNRSVRALGSTEDRPLDFRLVTATNQPLEQAVEEGTFRRDLFHRINVLSVELPPLRDRKEDIPELAESFVRHYARTHGRSLVRRLEPEAISALLGYAWPGNVRELENFIEQAVILCPDGVSSLPLDVFPDAVGGGGWRASAEEDLSAPGAGGATLAAVERRYIEAVLQDTGNNKARAARILGIDYKTLLRKLAAWKEDPPASPQGDPTR
ncbi:sigma-54 dependent transcriptional regulator [Thioalkalivibrio sp. ALJ24]|uniref:sigma-54-dependent transcriptional regulator n=1 Tax=Thioalkalivibrio sp. ALJ24 TaxID=545276 RepID=UPI0009FE4FEE|nr:sigma-54 dependent transcriptional regulator [Thioalkalivibrio sp. ALJ24]